MAASMAKLDPSIKTLGVVSLLNDAGSEMVYPLLPSFLLSTLGASPQSLGVIEGAAETAASVFKFLSGLLSDRVSRRKPFIAAGYGLSAACRPLISLARATWMVLIIRVVDRAGKGLRGAPRDALVAQVTEPSSRGRAFGFHRAMDNLGAVVGPILAAAALAVVSTPARVFLIATIPGLLATAAVILFVPEVPKAPAPKSAKDSVGDLPRGFYFYLGVISLFTLGNSSDTFLILRAQEGAPHAAVVPLLWALHNLVKALLSAPLGALSDRMGRKTSIGIGWGIYALAYWGFATLRLSLPLLFCLYALHYAFTEGPERALVAEFVRREEAGRAFGLYHGITGALLLPASLLTGTLWKAVGAHVALLTSGGFAALAAFCLLFVTVPGRGDERPVP